MAFQIADLYATIRADDAQMQTALPTLQSKLKRLELRMQGISRVARRMFLVVGGVLGLTVKFASDAEETHTKFLAVFKEEAAAAKAWGDAHANAVGRARMDMEKYLASMQDTFVPLGFARRESRKLSQDLVQLGIDLASFNNIADDKALRDLQSALVGNHEAIRRYGIIITETALKQELLNMGIEQNFKDVTIQQKVQARLNIIMRSSTDAQGDAIRTAGSFANQVKRLRGELKDLAADMGRALIPSLLGVIDFIRDIIGPIGEWIRQNQELSATLALLVLGATALLAILPKLIASFGILAAHPLAASLAAIGIVVAGLTADLMALNAQAAKAAGMAIGPRMGTAALERRLFLQQKNLVLLQGEIAKAGRTWGLGWLRGLGALKREYDATTIAIQQTMAAIEASKRQAEEKGETEVRASKAAEAAWIKAFTTIERSRLKAERLAIELLEDEIRAMSKAARAAGVFEQQKFNIIKYFDEQAARIKQKFADEETARREKAFWDAIRKEEALEGKIRARARERVGAARTAPAFTGIAELFKRIQSAILRSREEAEQRRLMKEAIKLERQQLATQKRMLTAVQAINIVPGLILTP